MNLTNAKEYLTLKKRRDEAFKRVKKFLIVEPIFEHLSNVRTVPWSYGDEGGIIIVDLFDEDSYISVEIGNRLPSNLILTINIHDLFKEELSIETMYVIDDLRNEIDSVNEEDEISIKINELIHEINLYESLLREQLCLQFSFEHNGEKLYYETFKDVLETIITL